MNPNLLDLPDEFSSERLRLRRYRSQDGAMYCAMLRANRAHLLEFMPPSLMGIENEADAIAEFGKQASEWDQRNLFIFGVWEKASEVYVGESHLANPDWNVPRIETGYFITQEHTGKGYATEAARATIRYAFENMQAARVVLRCNEDNLASARVAAHCGLVKEGCFRQHHRKKDGEVVDALWFGLLLSEWRNNPV